MPSLAITTSGWAMFFSIISSGVGEGGDEDASSNLALEGCYGEALPGVDPYRKLSRRGRLLKPTAVGTSFENRGQSVYHLSLIRRLYVHKFRCLENCELPISGHSSALLIGKNGAGKTTVGLVLEILQKIGRGTNRVGDLLKPKDLTRGRTDVPVRFEIEVELGSKVYAYLIAFEFPANFKELRILEERLTVGGKAVYARDLAQVNLARTDQENQATFNIDWHLVALPIIQQKSEQDPLFIFKRWLARMLILRPIPALILGESKEATLEPSLPVGDFGAWFAGPLAYAPSAYARIDG